MDVRMSRKDLDCVSKSGRGAKKCKIESARKVDRDAEKPRNCITHECTHNIYDCERKSTNCEAEDTKIRANLSC